MLIEHKITFQKDGLTITQRVGESVAGSPPNTNILVGDNALKGSFKDSVAARAVKPAAGGAPGDKPGGGGGPGDKPGGGGGPGDKPGGGGGPDGAGTAPIILIGPIVLVGPTSEIAKKSEE